MIRYLLFLFAVLPLAVAAEAPADDPAPDGIRPGGTISENAEAPPIPPAVKSMARPTRNFPEQPPMIPHSVRGYQVDTNFNQCLSCHSRSTTEASGAPMVSITHYRDRDGQPLAAVSPRRYFCEQCHLPQNEITPVIPSNFKGIDQVLQEAIEQRQ